MSRIAFEPWPAEIAERYRAAGYWRGEPLSELVERQARERPDASAVIDGARQLSYAELDRQAGHLARRLAISGLAHGDTALVQLGNQLEFYLVFLALLKIGVAPVNALFSHSRLELLAYAEQLQPRLFIGSRRHPLLADERFLDELQEAVSGLEQLLLEDDPEPRRNLSAWLQPPQCEVRIAPTAPGEVAFFQLSGGSTGTPKLIPRTHDDYAYSVRRSAEICAFDSCTRYLCALPAAHNFPLSSPGALGVFHAGGCVVLAADPSPASCFELIQRHALNVAALVPAALLLWLQAPAQERARLASLALLQVGGAALPESVARQVPGRLGCRLQQVFGMAEGLVNYTRLEDDDDHVFTTQGCPMSPADELRVVDPADREVAVGETGALLTRGPYTIRGYFRSPEHNAQAFTADGFYRSGDLVRQRADGYLEVVGRIKDQINRGGEKIAASEIESLLLQHPAVRQAALVSMPDAALGEKSCAFLVSADPALRGLVLRRFLRGLGLAEYKLPDRFELLDELPLTAVGKVDKARLRRRIGELTALPEQGTCA